MGGGGGGVIVGVWYSCCGDSGGVRMFYAE